MEKKTAELEPKYQVFAVELRKIKDGRYGHNLWYWILRLYLNVSLRIRLSRLNEDFNDNKLTRDQYNSFLSIIKSAI
jgi:hypothetical protein